MIITAQGDVLSRFLGVPFRLSVEVNLVTPPPNREKIVAWLDEAQEELVARGVFSWADEEAAQDE